MTRTAKQKAATSPKAATSNAITQDSTGCRCAAQLHFKGFPPPPAPGEGPLSDYLEARSGWHDRKTPCAALSIDDREARDQSEHSGGKIIFGSGRGQGLKHIRHADAWEVRQCAAELRNRAMSHLRRAKEIESAFAGIGGVL